jgi:hypothetical protein
MRHLTAPKGLEIMGSMSNTFVENLQSAETRPIFEKYDLVDMDPFAFFQAQRFLDAVNELGQRANLSANLIAIGMEVGKMMPTPEGKPNPTLEDMFRAWNGTYQGMHRNHHNDIGGMQVEKISDRHIKMTHTHIYPDDLIYGMTYAYCRRFLPKGTAFKVYYEPDMPRMDEGEGDKTVLHISW